MRVCVGGGAIWGEASWDVWPCGWDRDPVPRLRQGTVCLEAQHPPSTYIRRTGAVNAKLDQLLLHGNDASPAGPVAALQEMASSSRHGAAGKGESRSGCGQWVSSGGVHSRKRLLHSPPIRPPPAAPSASHPAAASARSDSPSDDLLYIPPPPQFLPLHNKAQQ